MPSTVIIAVSVPAAVLFCVLAICCIACTVAVIVYYKNRKSTKENVHAINEIRVETSVPAPPRPPVPPKPKSKPVQQRQFTVNVSYNLFPERSELPFYETLRK